VKLTTRLHLIPRFRMRGTLRPDPLKTFTMWYLGPKTIFIWYNRGSQGLDSAVAERRLKIKQGIIRCLLPEINYLNMAVVPSKEQLTSRTRVPLEKLTITRLVKKLPATGPYPQPDASGPQLPTLFH
jgi:hypothetical protein